MAAHWPPAAGAVPGDNRRAVRTHVAAQRPTERVRGLQLAGAFPISGM